MNKVKKDIELLIFKFAKKKGWEVVHGARGSKGSYWIKDGRYRMASIEPKKYGWLVGISNLLFRDLDDISTCRLIVPEGEYRFDKHKLTKNFWKVTDEDNLIAFLQQ